MKTHMLCMGPRYCLITKTTKTMIEERNLENCTEEEREIFMCDMRDREAIFSSLLKNDYNQIKSLITSHEVWKDSKKIYASNKYAKRIRLKKWICLFQEAIMMKDKFARSYIGRILKIVVGIKACGGTKDEDEIIWKILKTLTPPFK